MRSLPYVWLQLLSHMSMAKRIAKLHGTLACAAMPLLPQVRGGSSACLPGLLAELRLQKLCTYVSNYWQLQKRARQLSPCAGPANGAKDTAGAVQGSRGVLEHALRPSNPWTVSSRCPCMCDCQQKVGNSCLRVASSHGMHVLDAALCASSQGNAMGFLTAGGTTSSHSTLPAACGHYKITEGCSSLPRRGGC